MTPSKRPLLVARRTIRLNLAADTTATHCGYCVHEDEGWCRIFRRLILSADDNQGRRCTECIEAEKACQKGNRK